MDDSRGPLRVDEVAALAGPGGPLRRCEVVATAASTSTELLARLAADPGWADGGLLVAEHQRAGRGRGGHTWTTPAGTAVTMSLAVRPGVPRAAWGWLPLLAGLGVVRGLSAATGLAAAVKWPNDVLLPAPPGAQEVPGWGLDRKAVGILAEATPAGDAVVLGIGVNVAQTAAELPVPSATSLRLSGAPAADRTTVLVAVVREVCAVLARWRDGSGDVAAAGLDAEVAAVCRTLGAEVGATLPDGSRVRGRAVRIDPDGALVLRVADGSEQRLLAGDVRHVRPTRGHLP